MRCLVVTAAMLAGCQPTAEPIEPEELTVLVPTAATSLPDGVVWAAPPAKTAPLELAPVTFAEGGLRLAIVAEPHDVHPWDEGGVLLQTVGLDDDDVLRIVVRAGRGESLDGFRRDRDRWELSPETATTVCGRSARRLVAARAEEHITCIEYADGRPSSPGYIPATTSVAVAFEHRGLGVTAVWEVPTALREAYRPAENRFFSSIACD